VYATESEKMTQNLEDLRVRRTRKLLQKAMLEAASEKGFTHVTVSDITERAMVNRATFYRHYEDKYDLLTKYMEELSGLIEDEGESDLGNETAQSPDTPPRGMVKVLQHIQANADFYRVMLGKQGDPAYCAQTFRDYIEQGYRRIISNGDSKLESSQPPISLTVSYLLSAGIGAIVWWLESSQPYTPEQMATWLYQLSRASIDASMKSG
jgi:AcrR family transcriptional regulator